MKRILSLTALGLILSLAQPLDATPQEDAAFLADQIWTEQNLAQIRYTVRAAHAHQLRDLLKARSVRILDHDRFEAAIPDNLADPWVVRAHQITTAHVLQRYEPAELEGIVRTLRSDEEDLDTRTGFQLVAFMALVATHVERELTSEPLLLNQPFVADLLEINGIFQFPNRIHRRDLIREFRAQHQ